MSRPPGPCDLGAMPDSRFDASLVRRYDTPGPRYTSYPTAVQFTPAFGEADYRAAAERSRAERPGAPLSVYVHVPFCASPCFYCGCNRIITRQWGKGALYVRRLLREIEMQGALFERLRRIEQLHFGGGTPTFLDIPQLQEIMDALDRHFGLDEGENREFSIEIDPRTVHVGTLPQLASLGLNRLSLGVQDFDPRVQQAVNRIQSVKDTLDLIVEARHSGFKSVSVDLIYGLPLQTAASWEQTLRVVTAARPDRIAAYSYAHLPQKFKAQRQINAAQLPTPEEKLELLRLTVEHLTRAGYSYIGMDHFALPGDELARAAERGGLHRNFQGYSTRGGLDLVGLGISSIGRMGDSYAQNVKTLNAYYSRLDEGRLPVERGVRLTPDDHLRAEVIEALMCQGMLDLPAFEQRHGLRFREYFADALRQLEPLRRDGLVEIGRQRIVVTPPGRFLLRAVAMPFDAYLRAPSAAAAYSKVV